MEILKEKVSEIIRIKRINLVIFWVIIISLIASVVWAFTNGDNDSLGEKIFFGTNIYVIVTLIYIYWFYARLTRLPADRTLDNLFNWQKKTSLKTYKANRIFQIGFIQMYIISEMGIVIMERTYDDNLWIYCLSILAVGVLIFFRSLYSLNWSKKEYERLTGESFIPSI